MDRFGFQKGSSDSDAWAFEQYSVTLDDADNDDQSPPPGFALGQLQTLPRSVRALLNRHRAEHYWQAIEPRGTDWMAPASEDVLLIYWNGRDATRIRHYQTALHNSGRLYVFRRPARRRTASPGFNGSRATSIQSAMDWPEQDDPMPVQSAIADSKPLSLAISALDWDKYSYDPSRETLTGWIQLQRFEPHAGEQLTVTVKSDGDASETLAELRVTIKSAQARYPFTVPRLDADELTRRDIGQARFYARLADGRHIKGDHRQSAPARLKRISQLTIAQIAEQLTTLETKAGYASARQAARQLDYDALCELVNARGLAENDPNLMPSRFLLLPGCNDESLKSQGCLDPVPWPVHPDSPQLLSVAFLKHCLRLTGHLETDEPWPLWRSTTTEAPQTEHGRPLDSSDDTDESTHDTEPETPAEFDDAVLSAYKKYLKDRSGPRTSESSQQERQYRIRRTDSLCAIARRFGYPDWPCLQTANSDTLADPDRLEAGTDITLPALQTNDVKKWLKEHGERGLYWSGNGFEFPARYHSLALLDSRKTAVKGGGRVFAYRDSGDARHRFYNLTLPEDGRLKLLLPDSDDIRLGGLRVAPGNEKPRHPFATMNIDTAESHEANSDTDDANNKQPLPFGAQLVENDTESNC